MKNKWENVKKEHVISAINEFGKHPSAFPKAKNTFLLYKGERYPAKHIRGLAYKIANSRKIGKDKYSGGQETANFFNKLGFEVKYNKGQLKGILETPKKKIYSLKLSVVDQKNAIQKLLQEGLGIIETEKKFDWLKTPDPAQLPSEYKKIVMALKRYRNQEAFLKPKYPLACDIVVEQLKLIIEYDENQHFSQARKIALENYPARVGICFSKKYWIQQCAKLNRKDNDPVDRDEKRAYYDSVRDIEAFKHGYKLVRIKHGDFDWNSNDAITHLKILISNNPSHMKVIEKHKIARLVVSDKQYNNNGDPVLSKLKNVLVSFVNKSYPDTKFEFIVTPGGFLNFDWPSQFTDLIDLERPISDRDLKMFYNNAEQKINELFDSVDGVIIDRLRKTANYFTIGIDSNNPRNGQQIELVAVFDLKSQKVINWTGKFYPTISQENELIRINNLKSHFVKLNNQKIVILGCHDLNVFSPRGQAAADPKGWRKQLANKFKKLCHDFQPSIIIQHPHFTDTPNIWNVAWITLVKALPSVKHFASGIKFSNIEDDRPRGNLNEVLEKTKKGDVIDFDYT